MRIRSEARSTRRESSPARRANAPGVAAAIVAGVLTAALPACGRRSAEAPRADAGSDRPADSAGTPDVPATVDGAATTDRTPSDTSTATAAATAACRESILAQCRRNAACGRGSDVAGCAALVIDLCPDYYFNPRSLRTVAEVEACIPTFAQMTCTDLAMGLAPACLRRGTGAAGSPCLYNTECELGCPNGIDECSTCAAGTRVATGEACDNTRLCPETDYCHSVTRTCAPKASVVHAAAGEPCDFGAQPSVGCQGELVCARTGTTGTAGVCGTVPQQIGEPCVRTGDLGSTYTCGGGLTCDTQTTTCQVPPPPAGCGDGGACDDASFCRSGACVPRVAEGQLCRTTASPVIQCALGLWCVVVNLDAGRDGICTRPGTIGDACDAARPCAQSVCSTAGRCTAPAVAACQPI
jgi:hypothetical protein